MEWQGVSGFEVSKMGGGMSELNSAALHVEKCTDQKDVCKIDLDYEEFVEGLAERRDPKVFSNRSASHALSILRNVFKIAKNEVSIFSGKLDPCVYTDKILLDQAEKFVSAGGQVRVILQNDIPQDRKGGPEDFYHFAISRGKVKLVSDGHPLKDVKKHFLVSDNSVYRLELNIEEQSAVCSFNDEQRASQLSEIFKAAWENTNAQPIEL